MLWGTEDLLFTFNISLIVYNPRIYCISRYIVECEFHDLFNKDNLFLNIDFQFLAWQITLNTIQINTSSDFIIRRNLFYKNKSLKFARSTWTLNFVFVYIFWITQQRRTTINIRFKTQQSKEKTQLVIWLYKKQLFIYFSFLYVYNL